MVGTIPAAIFGGLARTAIDEHLGEPWMIAIALIVFGFVMLGRADRLPAAAASSTEINVRDGVFIGFAQALALIPGVSRSGDHDLRRVPAASTATPRRGFVPALVPACPQRPLRKALRGDRRGLPDGVVGPTIAGTIAAVVSGYAAIAWLLRYWRTTQLRVFVVYRIAGAPRACC